MEWMVTINRHYTIAVYHVTQAKQRRLNGKKKVYKLTTTRSSDVANNTGPMLLLALRDFSADSVSN